MDSKGVADSLQKPNVASSVQQPSHAINVSHGSFQQPFQQLRPLQPNLGSSQQSILLGSLKQSSLVSKVEPSAMHQDRSLKMSDDKVLVSHILGTHNPHGQEVDAKPFLRLVLEILSLGPRGNLSTDSPLITDAALLEKLQIAKKDAALLETLLNTIHQNTNKDFRLRKKLEIAKKDAALLETQLYMINQITNKDVEIFKNISSTIDQTTNKDPTIAERLLSMINQTDKKDVHLLARQLYTIDQTAKKEAPLLVELSYMIDQISNEVTTNHYF